MVDHKVHHMVIDCLDVRGHVAVRHFNENTRDTWMTCQTCGWHGPTYGRRQRKDILETWRLHAGDVVMGVDLSHGRPDYDCHCYDCMRALAAAQVVSRGAVR